MIISLVKKRKKNRYYVSLIDHLSIYFYILEQI